MTGAKNAIELRNVSFYYPQAERAAVHDVSMTVPAHSFAVLLGRNGSGKSTLAKLLNGLYTPVSGSVTVCGIDAGDSMHVREKCGMVFQNPDNQIVSTVVEEDVAFGPENLGIAPEEIRKRVDDALASVGIADLALASPSMLSGGQKQRVAIAGALAMRCDVLVFDEATAMLDPLGREEVFSLVQRLNREEGITVLWITHFMEEAAQADHVFVMDDGQITMEGTPRTVFADAKAVRALGLDVPVAAEFAQACRARGLALPEGLLTNDEVAAALDRIMAGTGGAGQCR